jgi:hypothetical protein
LARSTVPSRMGAGTSNSTVTACEEAGMENLSYSVRDLVRDLQDEGNGACHNRHATSLDEGWMIIADNFERVNWLNSGQATFT